MKIVFMGTPDFAVPCLDVLIDSGFDVVGVITAPDRPAGRGQELGQSAVKEAAIKHQLNVLQPTNLKDEAFLQSLKNLEAELFVVVAFRMLPEIVWNMPLKGTINLHASLLPQYRGAAPINWAIINGEKKTGVTTFFIEKEIDTGKIIYQEELAIADDESAGSLHDRLMDLGAKLIGKTVKAIEQGDYPQIEQDTNQVLKSASKIFRKDCEIDWTDTIDNIYNKIRGLSPYPAAWTKIDEKVFKIYELERVNDSKYEELSLFTNHASHFGIKLSDGCLQFIAIQMEGKKKMKVEEFLKGYKGNLILDKSNE